MTVVDEMLIMHHSHTDIGYTHPQPVALELHARFIDAAIDLCERTADRPEASQLRWTCEVTAPVLHWLQSAGSRQIERFRRLARAGRISGGAMWCNLTPLYSAEQIARSLYPVRLLRETLGLPLRVAINHDVNGLPWPITQLLRDADMELLIMGINIVCGGFPLSRPLVFRWQGSDEREILVFNGEHYGLFDHVARLASPSLENMQEGIAQYLKRLEGQGYCYPFAFLTATHHRCWDNAPPDPLLTELVQRWNAEGRRPVLRFATPEMLRERVSALPASRIKSYGGDWTDYWNFGCASSATEGRLNRQARGRLFAADALRAGCSTPPSPRQQQLHERAIWHLNMYEEHTWGAAQSITNPDSDRVANQWAHKAHYAHEAYSLSEMLLRDSLEAHIANPAAGRGVAAVLVYNPTPLSRQALVPVPKNWLDGTWAHNLSTVDNLGSGRESVLKDAVVIGPLVLPPWAVTSIDVKELPVAGSSDHCIVSSQRIESPFFELTFDSARGRITGLYRRHHKQNIIHAEDEWSFFGYVQETVDPTFQGAPEMGGRDAFVSNDLNKFLNNRSDWNPQWPARRRRSGALRGCETFQAVDGAGLILEFEAPGVESLRQTIKLCAHRPVVEMQVSIRKRDIRTAEGVYFVFPLALAEGWKAHYDTANLPVELDQEQLPGTARDGITVGQWVALHDAQLCVTLACPDAPMVQIGDFAFGRCRPRVPRRKNPLLLAWPLNNYWFTNFRASQSGWIQFRYELTIQDKFDPLTCTRAGLEAASEVVVHPVVAGGRAGTARLVESSDPRLLVLNMKPAENDRGLILRLANVTADAITSQLAIPGRDLAGAAWSDPLERDRQALPLVDGRVEVHMPARRLAAIHLY